MVYDLGIDVGTSYTAAAVRRPGGNVDVVGLGPIADNIPTVVYLGENGTLLIGDAAALVGSRSIPPVPPASSSGEWATPPR